MTLRVLVAYPYVTDRMLGIARETPELCWLIDSGAFTAWKSGKPIALDDYCRFIEKNAAAFWRYLTLDVIGDPVATERQFEQMRARGLQPIPIVTNGDSNDAIDRAFAADDLVALGGLVGGGAPAKIWAKAAHKHAAGRNLHILGFTSPEWLTYLKPWSADSSSWEQAGRFGVLPIYHGRGQFSTYKRADTLTKRPHERDLAKIAEWGFDPYQLRRDASWRGDNGMARWLGCCAWVAFSLDIERAMGTRLFLALSANRLDMLAGAYRIVTGQTTGRAAMTGRRPSKEGQANG